MTKTEAIEHVRNAYAHLMNDRAGSRDDANRYAEECEQVIAALTEETPRKSK